MDTVLNCGFDSFVVGDSNRMAYSAARHVAEVEHPIYNPVVFFGKSGCGKTHLARAIADERSRLYPEKKLLLINCVEMIRDLVNILTNDGDSAEFISEYSRYDTLIVYGVDVVLGKPQTVSCLLELIKQMTDASKTVVLTVGDNDKPTKEFFGALMKREEKLLLIDIMPPDKEVSQKYLKANAAQLGLTITSRAAEYAGERCKGSFFRLHNFLLTAHLYYSEAGGNITLKRAQKIL